MIDKNIKKFIDTNSDKIEIYIETGFKNGDSLRRVLDNNFHKYYTIEFYQKYLDKEKIFLQNNVNKVIPVKGNSGEVLGRLFNEFSIQNDVSACVYLDAHGHDSKISPLLDELKALKKNNRINDLIIIDDVYFIENAKVDRQRAPWATEIADIGGLDKIYTLLREIHGQDAIIEKKSYYPGPIWRTMINRYNRFSDQGKNYHLTSRRKNF
jgi:hypothetical protein